MVGSGILQGAQQCNLITTQSSIQEDFSKNLKKIEKFVFIFRNVPITEEDV